MIHFVIAKWILNWLENKKTKIIKRSFIRKFGSYLRSVRFDLCNKKCK